MRSEGGIGSDEEANSVNLFSSNVGALPKTANPSEYNLGASRNNRSAVTYNKLGSTQKMKRANT
jgi:hypothetical protein